MKRLFFCLTAAGLVFSGCFRQKLPRPETTWYRDFSLGSVVERMKVPQLRPMHGGGGSGESIGETVRRRREFNLTFHIEEREGAKFDETRFIDQLKAEIVKVMNEFGVHQSGGGSSNDAFHFDYSTQEHDGLLEVVGVRAVGNQYKLWGVMRENIKDKKD